MLRDFGQSATNQDQPSAIGVSPDGERAALLVRQPDIARNSFCQTLVIVALGASAPPILIDVAAQPIIWAPDIRGLLTPNGSFVANPPQWSPDGHNLAFRVPVGGTPQVLAIDVATGARRHVTATIAGVDDFAWSRDGSAIIFATRPELPAHEVALDREARSGFHYDRRISPMFAVRPMTPANLAVTYRAVALDTGTERPATALERSTLGGASTLGHPLEAAITAPDNSGRIAWLRAPEPGKPSPSGSTLTMMIGSSVTRCAVPTCRGKLFDVRWAGDAIVYLRREGWADSMTTIYRWRPGGRPIRLLTTPDALLGCEITGSKMLCGRESSRQPRRLWSFDVQSRAQRVVYDPNPGFAVHRTARVERLHWRGLRGAEGYGDLVVPEGKPLKRGFPMIVVQYRTRGFLRGAIGDEYPIFPLAARGFAVLSIEEANFDTFAGGDSSPGANLEAMRAAAADNGERRLQQANLEAGIASARATVRIDSGRMGISGISDAASSAVYALASTDLFSVAALGTPVIDPSVLAIGGHALQEQFRFMGYPPTIGDHDEFYRALALTPNAERLHIPFLFQWSDTEYLGGMAAVTALEEAHVPVDLYIFPSEYHVKYQPAHRLAAYERNLDWFDFWLNGRETASHGKRAQVTRWRKLRDQACAVGPVPRIPAQLCSHASTSTKEDRRE